MKSDFETTVIRMLTEIQGDVSKLQKDMSKTQQDVSKLQEQSSKTQQDIDIIKNVNLAAILKGQQQIRKELNDKIDGVEERLNAKLDKYIKQNEVDHKRFDYKISNMELKLGVAENTEEYNIKENQ